MSNIEIDPTENGDISARSNAHVYEYNPRGETIWACRNELILRRVDGALKMAKKKVILANNEAPLFTLSFLI